VAEMNNLVELLSQLQEQTNPPERSKPAANSGGGGQTTCTRCPKPKKPAARRRSGKTSIVRCRIKKGSRMARLFIFLIFDQKVYLQLSMTSTQSPPRPARPPPSPPSSIQPAGFQLIELLLQRLNFPTMVSANMGGALHASMTRIAQNHIFHTRLADHRSFFSPSPAVRKNATSGSEISFRFNKIVTIAGSPCPAFYGMKRYHVGPLRCY
jgi:hypothetical protein